MQRSVAAGAVQKMQACVSRMLRLRDAVCAPPYVFPPLDIKCSMPVFCDKLVCVVEFGQTQCCAESMCYVQQITVTEYHARLYT